jgi:hypothetical protein
MSEQFLGAITVEKIVIVNDYSFLHPEKEEMCQVRPVSMTQMVQDSEKLEKQVLYFYPQHDDINKGVFLVHYERNPDK